jgi:hypothetical protein
VSPVRYELGFISQKTFFIVSAVNNSNLILFSDFKDQTIDCHLQDHRHLRGPTAQTHTRTHTNEALSSIFNVNEFGNEINTVG